MSRTRLVNRDLNPLLTTLPEKFSSIHDYQVGPIMEIVEAFDRGVKAVVLDAPTGSGKTLIAEVVRRMIDTRGVYVCHNKELQSQFARDFGYSRVLYGRSNYTPTARRLDRATCDDCTWTQASKSCSLCEERKNCPYVVARTRAIHSVVPVLNSAYWLSETQSPRTAFGNTGLTILDEADTLENVLMGQVEVRISGKRAKELGIEPPRLLTKEWSYVEWGKGVKSNLVSRVSDLRNGRTLDIKRTRELRSLEGLLSNVSDMVGGIQADDPWVYTGGAGSDRRRGDDLSFRPVRVSGFGQSRIWSKDKRFLLMSGSVVSSSMLMSDLGWDGSEEFVTVSMPSQFHAKNRQVVVRPVADMTRKGATDDGFTRLVESCRAISEGTPGANILVHSVSYSLAARLTKELGTTRTVCSYNMGSTRAAAIAKFRRTPGAILVAPSADRGVDLPHEACRVQIILKVPYLSLGDKQTSERLYKTPNGALWYNVQVARTLMQMVGRGVRSTDDYCICYVLDKDFVKWYRAWGHLFPGWFRKGIRFESVSG